MPHTTDRLFRHMAWANAQTFAVLATLPEAIYAHSEPGNDWNVGKLAAHIAQSARYLASLLDGAEFVPLPFERVSTHDELRITADACAAADGRLRLAAQLPEGVVVRKTNAQTTRARSTILAQAIHHATEHRAQIAGALVAHGSKALVLDTLGLWAYGDAEGLGE